VGERSVRAMPLGVYSKRGRGEDIKRRKSVRGRVGFPVFQHE